MKRGGFLKRRTPLKAKTGLSRKTPWKVSKRPVKRPKQPSKLKVQLPKIWGMDKADDEFSLFIRKRDGRCMFPGCTVEEIAKLQCSHYIGRAHKATRYDPENCIALCWFHHFKSKDLGFEYQKQTVEKHGWDGQYTLFMKKWLGTERFYALVARGGTVKKLRQAILDVMAFLGF